MSDLIERLRHKADMIGDGSHGQKLLVEAADELERLLAEQSAMIENVRFARERAERAEAERDALRADAERYRWLRTNRLQEDAGSWWLSMSTYPHDMENGGDSLDAAIDAAISGAKQS